MPKRSTTGLLVSPGGRARIYKKALPSRGAKLNLTPIVKALQKQVLKTAHSHTQTQTRTEEEKKRKRVGSHSVGRYRGTFTKRRFPGKRGSPSKKSENHYSRYGATDTLEVSGTITDPDCVYVGHSSFSTVRLFETCLVAMYRKLYIAAIGYDVSAIDEILPYKNGNSDGHTIHVYFRDPNGVMQTIFQAVPQGTSLKGLSSPSFTFSKCFWTACLEKRVITRVYIVDNDTNLTRATLDVTRLKFDYQFKSELKIQNVTIPQTNSNEADDVDNVPLVGRSYEFNNWSPRTNGQNVYPASPNSPTDWISMVNEYEGVTLVRAAQLPTAMKEPPPSSIFTNCKKSGKVRLQPGDIKSDWLIGGGTISFENMNLALEFSNSIPVVNRRVRIGKNAMIAVEKLIGLAGTLPIKINYECNHYVGVVAKAGWSHGVVGTFNQHTHNNTG